MEPDQALMEAGLDSLAAVELRTAVAAAFGTAMPATLALDYPTLRVRLLSRVFMTARCFCMHAACCCCCTGSGRLCCGECYKNDHPRSASKRSRNRPFQHHGCDPQYLQDCPGG